MFLLGSSKAQKITTRNQVDEDGKGKASYTNKEQSKDTFKIFQVINNSKAGAWEITYNIYYIIYVHFQTV